MPKVFQCLIAALGLVLACLQAVALTSLEITEKTLAALPQCLHYQVQGVCYWLSSAGITATTPYISHYLPDAVVSVFNPPSDSGGGNVWSEVQVTLDFAGALAQKQLIASMAHTKAGGGEHGLENPQEAGVFFKEVDVIGNPALAVLPDTPVLLPSATTPLKP